MEQLNERRMEVITLKYSVAVAARQNQRLGDVSKKLERIQNASSTGPQPAANKENSQLLSQMAALMTQRNRRVVLSLVDVINTMYAALKYAYFVVSVPPFLFHAPSSTDAAVTCHKHHVS